MEGVFPLLFRLSLVLVIAIVVIIALRDVGLLRGFRVIVVLAVAFGGALYWNEITQDRQAADLYVEKHYSPSPSLYALNPDRQSGTWSAESKDLDCLSPDYHCTDVHFSVNVLMGSEVRRLDCVWRIRSSWGSHKIVWVKPNNTEARELFLLRGLPPGRESPPGGYSPDDSSAPKEK